METVWIKGKREKNIEICFALTVEFSKSASLSIIAKDVYNLYVNGVFLHYGPARAAQGCARVDRLDLSPYMQTGKNVICCYVTEVNSSSLCFAEGAPYFGAELTVDGKRYSTQAFQAYLMGDRVARVERMSSQRGYVEVYTTEHDRRELAAADYLPVEVEEAPSPKLLERGVRYGRYESVAATPVERGRVELDDSKKWSCHFREELETGGNLKAYTLAECDCRLSDELVRFVYKKEGAEGLPYALYDFGKTYSGKLVCKLRVKEKATVWASYDDILMDGQLCFHRESVIHGLKWTLGVGEYTLHSSEVYTARYLALVWEGEIEVEEVALICVENPDVRARKLSDEELNSVAEAARRTFEQNAYDIYTDCPSRERAGWLCDSYFMAKAERFYTGESRVEKNFLENYLLYEGKVLDEGAVPMCYPSKPRHAEQYIPNWILWYLIELRDYRLATGDGAFIQKHRSRVEGILKLFEGFENEYGLLENLRGWVFVEWSKANEFVQDVNFPSNMLYVGALRAAAELLEKECLLEKATVLKKKIIELSFNGRYFRDNAVRGADGKLQVTENISETCQYYAAFFEILTKGEAPAFYTRIVEELGKFQDNPEGIHPSNMFIGYILRLTLLHSLGEKERLLKECKAQFLPMAERTGTLWENFGGNASCNHGFASVVGYLIEDAIGVECENMKKRKEEQ